MIVPPSLFLLLAVFSPVLALGNGYVLARLTVRRRKSMTDQRWDDKTYRSMVAFIAQRRDGARYEALSMARRWDTVRAGAAAIVWAELDDLIRDMENEQNPIKEPREEEEERESGEPEGSGPPAG